MEIASFSRDERRRVYSEVFGDIEVEIDDFAPENGMYDPANWEIDPVAASTTATTAFPAAAAALDDYEPPSPPRICRIQPPPIKKRRVEDLTGERKLLANGTSAVITPSKAGASAFKHDFTDKGVQGTMVTILQGMAEKWDNACGWDGHKFNGKPCQCPTEYDDRRKRFKFFGYFCSWNCVQAWGNVYLPAMRKPFLGMWIMMLMRALRHAELQVQGVTGDCKREVMAKFYDDFHVEAAPSYWLLDSWGGKLTIEQFRNIHCQAVRTIAYPEYMRMIPLGINVFSIPRLHDPADDEDPKPVAISAPAAAVKREAAKTVSENKRGRGPARATGFRIMHDDQEDNAQAVPLTSKNLKQQLKLQRARPARENALKRVMGITSPAVSVAEQKGAGYEQEPRVELKPQAQEKHSLHTATEPESKRKVLQLHADQAEDKKHELKVQQQSQKAKTQAKAKSRAKTKAQPPQEEQEQEKKQQPKQRKQQAKLKGKAK